MAVGPAYKNQKVFGALSKMVYEHRNLKKPKIKISFALILLLYYWLVANVLDFGELTSSGLFIFVQLPIILFVAFQIRFFELRYRNNINAAFLVFLVVVILINVVRNDFKLILSTAVDVLPVYLILTNKRNTISLRFINVIFLLQMVICIYSYYAGINPYGFVTGQSTIPEYPWKVSLFSYLTPPCTSIFSFLVFLVNMESKSKRKLVDIAVIVFAVYFIIFSGSRTTYLICFFYLMYKFVSRFLPLNKSPKFYLYFPFVVISFSLFFGMAVKSLDSPLLNAMFIRNVDQTANYKASEDLDRYVMWKEYLNTFQEHWLIGAGYFDVTKFLPAKVGTTETLLPMMLAFHGIVYLIFLAVMIKIMRLAIQHNLAVSYMLVITFFVACSFYGSYMRGYNLIWILIFMLIANEFNRSGVLKGKALTIPRFKKRSIQFLSR